MSPEFDPSLMQDFLTEASELIEQFDADLVKLESVQHDQDASRELLNSLFRQLHTVKGAASFLGLTAVTTFAHAAEDALNRLRRGEVGVTPFIVDMLLRSIDVLRGMIVALNSGHEAPQAPDDLIAALRTIADLALDEAAPAPAIGAASAAGAEAVDGVQANGPAPRPMNLPAQKQELVGFMVHELHDASQQIERCLIEARDAVNRADAGAELAQVAEGAAKVADFFELNDLKALMQLLADAAGKLGAAPEASVGELLIRLQAVRALLDDQALAVENNLAMSWPVGTLTRRIVALANGQTLDETIAGKHGDDVATVLALDGVIADQGGATLARSGTEASLDLAKCIAPNAAEVCGNEERRAGDRRMSDRRDEDRSDAPSKGKNALAEQTIRVEVGRLEALLNLVGQMVLTKNRVLAMSRQLREQELPAELKEEMAASAGNLDRLTGELQLGVMRTRMQPLAKLFERYPRVIRDLARATGKKINLEMVGKETEVDKSVLELLADPLVHLLRNSADHGIELPEQRVQAGKPQVGTIRLRAEHQGSHVRVEIADDGKGLDREALGRKAVEKGLTTPEQLVGMSDADVFRFIFDAGFSTAEKVTDLSGRGVGMDVVRTNVTKLNGTIHISASRGQGTMIEILIPLTVAIMPTMVVHVGGDPYCIPLQSIVEIVRPPEEAIHTIKGQKVMRLRESVLPLIDMHARLNPGGPGAVSRFAVVVGVGEHRAGLMVDRLIGQQEIVIKPLDDKQLQAGPFSGATICENGEVSLILDVMQLVQQTQGRNPSPWQRSAA